MVFSLMCGFLDPCMPYRDQYCHKWADPNLNLHNVSFDTGNPTTPQSIPVVYLPIGIVSACVLCVNCWLVVV